jgi:hypothetical protein
MPHDARLPWTTIPWLAAAGLIVGALGPAIHRGVVGAPAEPWSDDRLALLIYLTVVHAMTTAGVALTLTTIRRWWLRIPVAAALGLLADVVGDLVSGPWGWGLSESSALCCFGAVWMTVQHGLAAPLVRGCDTSVALVWWLLAAFGAGTIAVEITPRLTRGGALTHAIVIAMTQCVALAGALSFPSKEPAPLSIRRFGLRGALVTVALLAAALAGGIRLHYRFEIDGRNAADASMLDGSSPWIWSDAGWSLPRPGFVPP